MGTHRTGLPLHLASIGAHTAGLLSTTSSTSSHDRTRLMCSERGRTRRMWTMTPRPGRLTQWPHRTTSRVRRLRATRPTPPIHRRTSLPRLLPQPVVPDPAVRASAAAPSMAYGPPVVMPPAPYPSMFPPMYGFLSPSAAASLSGPVLPSHTPVTIMYPTELLLAQQYAHSNPYAAYPPLYLLPSPPQSMVWRCHRRRWRRPASCRLARPCPCPYSSSRTRRAGRRRRSGSFCNKCSSNRSRSRSSKKYPSGKIAALEQQRDKQTAAVDCVDESDVVK